METQHLLSCQKDKFKLEEHITYLNGAYMSPSLKSVEEAGHKAVTQKCHPYTVKPEDFFTNSKKLRKLFAKFIDADDYQNTAIIPSASYGLSTVANNVKLDAGDEIILIEEQFPSNVYTWQKLADKNNAIIRFISAPKGYKNRAEQWNKNILDSISSKTKVVAIAPNHWADGTLYDLKAIRKKTNEYNVLLVIDGSQNIGAMPFSVKEIQPDALVTVAYKWMLGPYSMGMAYYSDYFNDGEPIEENWINRHNSEDFTALVNYEHNYQPKAGRYNMGEVSNFVNTPMLLKSIAQLQEWQPKNIQNYCDVISKYAIEKLRNLGCFVEEDKYRAKNLFGVYLPEHINLEKLKAKFVANNIFVSFRGNAIRISPNVYNDKADFEKLLECFE